MYQPTWSRPGSSAARPLGLRINQLGASSRPYRSSFGGSSLSERIQRITRPTKAQLDEYEVPAAIRILYESKFKRTSSYGPEEDELLAEVTSARLGSPLTVDNYKQRLRVLNQIEDEHLHREFRKCTIQAPQLVVQLKHSSIIKEDTGVRFSVEGHDKMIKFSGTVHKKDRKNLTIFTEKPIPFSSVIKMEFLAERTSFQMEYRALEMLHDSLIEKMLFPENVTGKSTTYDYLNCIRYDHTEFEWFCPSVANNREQAQAIKNIFNQTSFPAPYVLFGPPGTGKTSTLVEAIGQIYKLKPYANVLAVATSNSAADELTSRLLHIIPEDKIFRYFAKSMARKKGDIEQDVLDVSNLTGWHYGMDSKDFYENIRPCRVITCTLTTAGRLLDSKIPKDHFSYIFVDECGSAKEISCLVPIVGMGTDEDSVTASVILAGDPKQLGPVIQYEFLDQTSHSISLLERITAHGMYKKSTHSGEYDVRVITQLRDNFRSHKSILDLPNRLFYEGMLRAKAAPEKANWAVGWPKLPNTTFPMIFHSINGTTMQDENSSSMYNIEEAETIFGYVEEMLTCGINSKSIEQSDIGIISPYARQVRYLKELCKSRRWDDIDIGSTEQYQGREKPIMLMSTVRSGGKSVGFLANTKRLNVSITRAQALLIIVGNTSTLAMNVHWRKLIDYYKQNNALKVDVSTTSLRKHGNHQGAIRKNIKPNVKTNVDRKSAELSSSLGLLLAALPRQRHIDEMRALQREDNLTAIMRQLALDSSESD